MTKVQITKVLIITGASSGIGRSVAQRLAWWDGLLVLSGRSERRLNKTRTEVESAGGRAITFPRDLTEPEAAVELVSEAEKHGSLTAAVLAAGAASGGKILDQPTAELQAALETNLVAPYSLARAALRVMAPRKQGHLIFINSVAGMKAFPASSAYVAAKHGLRGFTESLRLEAREHQIAVTSIFPGATDTPWWDRTSGDFPRERMLPPEDVAAAVDFVLRLGPRSVVEELVLRHQAGDF